MCCATKNSDAVIPSSSETRQLNVKLRKFQKQPEQQTNKQTNKQISKRISLTALTGSMCFSCSYITHRTAMCSAHRHLKQTRKETNT